MTSDGKQAGISDGRRLINITEYEELQTHLRQQLKECIARISQFRENDDDEHKKDTVEVVDQVSDKVSDILEANARKLLRKNIVEMFLYSEEGFKAIYCESASDLKSENPTSEPRSAISSMLQELFGINCDILKKIKILQKLQQESQNQDSSICDLTLRTKEKTAILQRAKELGIMEDRQLECEKKFPKIKVAREKLEGDVRKLRFVKQIFQTLIQASKVDWFENDELREMMVELGTDTKLTFNHKPNEESE